MNRRSPMLALIALPLILGGYLLWFVVNFDADHYRQRLQAELAAALGHPVQLEKAAFALRPGPALAFTGLRIDAADAGFSLHAGHLYLRLEWGPLLRGEISFSRIILKSPRLHLALHPVTDARSSPIRPRFELLNSAAITSLIVEDGQLVVEDRRDTGRNGTFELRRLNGEITDLAKEHSAWVRFTGHLPQGGENSTFVMAGEITPPQGPGWQTTRVSLGVLLEGFQPGPAMDALTGFSAETVSGEGRLEITLEGSPAEGMRGALRLHGADLALHAPHGPIPLSDLGISGVWMADPTAHRLRDLKLTFDDLALEGEVAWRYQEADPRLEARLRSSAIPIASLKRYLPPEPGLLQDVNGTLQITSLELSAPVTSLGHPHAVLPLLTGEGTLSHGSFPLPALGIAEGVSASLALSENTLEIADGRGTLLEAPIAFSARLEDPFTAARSFRASAQGEIPVEHLTHLLPQETGERLSLSGPAPLTLGLSGRRGDLRLDMTADLEKLSARWQESPVKEAGHKGSLTVSAVISETQLTLDFVRLDLPGAALRANGFRLHAPPHDLSLQLDLSVPNLQNAPPLLPSWAKFQPRGEVALRGEVTRSSRGWSRKGTLFLRGAALRIGVLDDIQQITGSVRLTEKGAEIERLSARLGTSPVAIDGGLASFSEPRLKLRVRGSAIRADEIIFPSPRAVLRDIDAHLAIERDRVAFSEIRVRLDGGTTAVVKGEVRDFANPVVELDIRAPYGDIDEVIALWETPEKKGAAAEKKQERHTRVRISAGVEGGKIGNLKFEEAEGVVSWERGVLTVHPLHFRTAGGECTGRVLVEGRPEGHRLHVSGHLVDAEAADLQHDLLKIRGLVSGRLTGDFSVEGTIGPDFRPTSMGGLHVVVDRGVLHRLSALSKVFSILNVSQIFSLRLPDMSREGMPFNRMKAAFTLREGRLETEDLLVDSHAMNMSLVGSLDLNSERIDATLAVKPLRTVDKIVTRIPLAGWLLAGEEKALITAHFNIRGPLGGPEVVPVPITSVSEKTVGIFRRLFGLPARFAENLEDLVREESR